MLGERPGDRAGPGRARAEKVAPWSHSEGQETDQGRGQGLLPLGCRHAPTPNSQPGTYLMAFFSLRPRPESGVPTVSKEFL